MADRGHRSRVRREEVDSEISAPHERTSTGEGSIAPAGRPERAGTGPNPVPRELRTRDPALLRATVAEATTSHDIRLRGAGIDGLADTARMHGTNLVFIRYGGDVVIEAPPTDERFTLTLPLGPMSVGYRRLTGGDVRTSAFVLDAGHRTLMGPDPWAGALVLATDLRRLRDHLAAVLGHPISGRLEFPTTAQDGGLLARRHLDAAAELAWHAVRSHPPSAATARLLEQNLLSTVLLSLPHSQLAALRAAPREPSASHAEAARDWLEEHFAEPVGVVDVARAVRLSVRQVQTVVSRQFQSTPMELLRDIRLRRAREMLRGGNTTVSQVARRCGITHLGRFSVAYRQRYGETPSATLRSADAGR